MLSNLTTELCAEIIFCYSVGIPLKEMGFLWLYTHYDNINYGKRYTFRYLSLMQLYVRPKGIFRGVLLLVFFVFKEQCFYYRRIYPQGFSCKGHHFKMSNILVGNLLHNRIKKKDGRTRVKTTPSPPTGPLSPTA